MARFVPVGTFNGFFWVLMEDCGLGDGYFLGTRQGERSPSTLSAHFFPGTSTSPGSWLAILDSSLDYPSDRHFQGAVEALEKISGIGELPWKETGRDIWDFQGCPVYRRRWSTPTPN